MQARVGDHIVVRSRHIGEPERDGQIIEVRGPSGQPPYIVRWTSDGHVGLYFPSSDAVIQRGRDVTSTPPPP